MDLARTKIFWFCGFAYCADCIVSVKQHRLEHHAMSVPEDITDLVSYSANRWPKEVEPENSEKHEMCISCGIQVGVYFVS